MVDDRPNGMRQARRNNKIASLRADAGTQPEVSPHKIRERKHVIADLSENHVERFILLEGHTSQSIRRDYGYDLVVTTFAANGAQENGNIYIQLKATDQLRLHDDGETIAHSISLKDVETWRREIMPVIFIVYNTKADEASWLYLQDYFENSPLFRIPEQQSTMTIYLLRHNIIDRQAIARFRRFKEDVQKQLSGVVRHHAQDNDL